MRRSILLGLLIIMSVGCAKVPGRTLPAGTPVPGGDAYVTLRVFTGAAANITHAPLNAAIAAYHDANPSIRIELVPLPRERTSDRTAFLQEALEQGTIDLFPVWPNTIGQLVEQQLVTPLDPLIQRDRVDLAPYGRLVDGLRVGGALYDLPTHLAPMGIIYNRDLFVAQGVPLPKPGWTWQEFRTAAGRLTSGEGATKVWGVHSEFGMDNLLYAMLGERTRDAPIDVDTAGEILQFWSTMVAGDRSVPAYPAGDDPHPAPVFEQGGAAMTLAGPSVILREVPFQWDVVPYPTFHAEMEQATVHAVTWALAANTSRSDAAWHFLQFLTGAPGAVIFATAGEFPAYRTAEVKNAWFNRTPAPAPGSETFFAIDFSLQEQRGSAIATWACYAELRDSFYEVMRTQVPWETSLRNFTAKCNSR